MSPCSNPHLRILFKVASNLHPNLSSSRTRNTTPSRRSSTHAVAATDSSTSSNGLDTKIQSNPRPGNQRPISPRHQNSFESSTTGTVQASQGPRSTPRRPLPRRRLRNDEPLSARREPRACSVPSFALASHLHLAVLPTFHYFVLHFLLPQPSRRTSKLGRSLTSNSTANHSTHTTPTTSMEARPRRRRTENKHKPSEGGRVY